MAQKIKPQNCLLWINRGKDDGLFPGDHVCGMTLSSPKLASEIFYCYTGDYYSCAELSKEQMDSMNIDYDCTFKNLSLDREKKQ